MNRKERNSARAANAPISRDVMTNDVVRRTDEIREKRKRGLRDLALDLCCSYSYVLT